MAASKAPVTSRSHSIAATRPAAPSVPTAAGLLLIASLWLIVRPYRGVRHDAILYLGQVLGRLMPDTVGHDLFLAYGSQDRYSVFSPVMAPLVRWLGVGTSEMVMLLAMGASFLLACWRLTAVLPSAPLRWWAMLSLTAVSHVYGNGGMFAFAEPFLTARTMCEPLVVLSLAFLLEGRAAAAWTAMMVAMLIHPLIALPAIVVGWLYFSLDDRRWLWLGTAAVVPVLAGAMGVAPFDGLWHRYDPEWLGAVQTANPQVFIADSTMLDWAPTAFDVGLLLLVAQSMRGSSMARLIHAVVICAAGCMVVWGLGCDVVRNVLITQLQLWRALWLTHLLAVLTLPVLLLEVWRRGAGGRWTAAAIVLATVSIGANLSTGWLCVLWAGIAFAILRRGIALSRGVVVLATVASVAGVLIVTALVGLQTLRVVEVVPGRFDGVGIAQIFLGLTVCCATLGFLLLQGLMKPGLWRRVALAVICALAVEAGWNWDQRSDWQRFVENGLQGTNLPFENAIAPSAKVYWGESLFEAWMLTHKADYFGTEQSAGLLFNRATFAAFSAHQRAVAPLLAKRAICQTVASLTGGEVDNPDTCAPTLQDIKALCATPDGPDVIVLRAGPSGETLGATATWAFAPDDPIRRRGYRMYDCGRLK